MDATYHVAIIGAGPAGLFAARELAEQGMHVTVLTVILNRAVWQNMEFIPTSII